MNYYNEFDPKAAEWIKELINQKLIPDGIVDTRSICDVRATELMEYTQCHFFAGIAGWSKALQLAGVDPDEPLWTGSCPCQAFSTAGKQKGFDDHRDLWPVFFNLIRECRPSKVFGEQVANAIKFGWLDRVYADLESAGYAVGSAVIGAHSVGAPHQRQRLYWGAERVSDCNERRFASHSPIERESRIARSGADLRLSNTTGGQREQPIRTQRNVLQRSADDLPDNRLAENAASIGCGGRSDGDSAGQGREVQTPGLCACGGVPAVALGDGSGERLQGHAGNGDDRNEPGRHGENAAGPVTTTSGNDNLPSVPWNKYALIYCRDNKARRVPAESVLQCMADGISGCMDIGRADRGFPLCKSDSFQKGQIAVLLKGYGNSINPYTAAEFIKAFNFKEGK